MIELLVIAVIVLMLLFLFADMWWLNWLSASKVTYRSSLIIVLISALIGLMLAVIMDLPPYITYSFVIGGFGIAAADRAVRRRT